MSPEFPLVPIPRSHNTSPKTPRIFSTTTEILHVHPKGGRRSELTGRIHNNLRPKEYPFL
ncbi:hypothetical protein PIIN_09236 [Serendipita indica DSM 11827]|uniref:Uncharacterized protein n=1 Tax=Serendipita indica (strain DSM 11827) TaxID=1109443 RepID=G4TVA9_SERID|nr:hypothetical protein PIIN_09236 [Serendipita indica DSM 11827]